MTFKSLSFQRRWIIVCFLHFSTVLKLKSNLPDLDRLFKCQLMSHLVIRLFYNALNTITKKKDNSSFKVIFLVWNRRKMNRSVETTRSSPSTCCSSLWSKPIRTNSTSSTSEKMSRDQTGSTRRGRTWCTVSESYRRVLFSKNIQRVNNENHSRLQNIITWN